MTKILAIEDNEAELAELGGHPRGTLQPGHPQYYGRTHEDALYAE